MRKIGQAHWALTSWDSVNCPDVEYLVEIIGQIQNSPQAVIEFSSYWASFTYFELPMPCSTAYNLTVRSRNRAAVGDPSSIWTGITGTARSSPYSTLTEEGIDSDKILISKITFILMIRPVEASEEKAKECYE